MTERFPSDPNSARPLIHHLATWGEVAVCELKQWKESHTWVEFLVEAGIVEMVHVVNYEPLSWALSPRAEDLPEAELKTAVKLALFQISAYRAHLVGILTEGLAQAAKVEMRDRLESWTGEELVSLLGEIKSVLDFIEKTGNRLIDGTAEEIRHRFAELPSRKHDFSFWDQFLLGRTGGGQDLFDFVLKRFAPHATLTDGSNHNKTLTVLQHLPLNSEEGDSTQRSLEPAPGRR